MESIIIIIAVLAVRVVMEMPIKQLVRQNFRRLKQRMIKHKNTGIFDSSYIDAKAFYLEEFGKAPCVNFVNSVNVNKHLLILRKVMRETCWQYTSVIITIGSRKGRSFQKRFHPRK
jgi:hypothetical protein